MTTEYILKKAQAEIENGLETCNCNKCSCMIEPLNEIKNFLDSHKPTDYSFDFRAKVGSYLKELKSAESS